MIIDYYYPNGFDEISFPHLYERTRDANGNLYVSIISPDDEKYVKPHCWIPVDTNPRRLGRVMSRYQGVYVDAEQRAEGLDGKQLKKMIVPNPRAFWDIKKEIDTYEADKPYEDQYLLQTYPEKIPEFVPRIWYFDLEWDVNDGFLTVMAIDDSHAEHPVVFAWRENQEHTVDWIDREGGYMLYLYDNETDMCNAFLDHLEECDPDILCAHAIMWADLPKLMERLPDPRRLSPIGEIVKPHAKYGYKETQQPIKGRLCFDSAAKGMSGSGFETLWIKSGRGQLPSRKLDTIAKALGLGGKIDEDEDGNKLNVLTWWRSHFDLFVDYCLRDTTLLRQCDEKLNAIPFLVAMQQFCGVRFQSVHRVTNYVRGLFGRYSDLKAPSMYNRQRDTLTAAHVLETKAGRHQNVALVDFASLYPILIVCLNLCPTTKRSKFDTEGNIRQLPDGSRWEQDEKGILPSIVEDMLLLRKEYKKLAKEATNEDDKFKNDMMQLAVKVCTNAIYGYVSSSAIGGMWTDPDVGAAITSMGRESITLLMTEAERQGYTVLAGHTDSCYIQGPFEEIPPLVEHLNKTIRTELKLPLMDVEFEAFFDYWTTANSKNRNFGIITWPESKKGDLKVTGYGLKAANSSPLTRDIQRTMFRMISEGAEENDVSKEIRPISLALRKGEKSIEDLAPYGRLGKASYDRVPPNGAKGALYYNENMASNDPFRVGDSGQWVYVNSVPDGFPTTNIVSFRDAEEIKDFSLDYDLMVEKFIRKKLEPIYEVLDWDLGFACGDKMPKEYW